MATLDDLIKISLGNAPAGQPVTVPYMPGQPAAPAAPATTPLWKDPTFLIDVGSRLLAPRSETQGQFGFASAALNEALANMRQRQAGTRAEQRQERGLGLQERQVATQEKRTELEGKKTEREITSADVIDKLRGAQTEESQARAKRLLADAKTAGATSVAAAVQETQRLADSLMQTHPDKYEGPAGKEQAYLDAFTLKEQSGQNPDLWFANAVKDYMSGEGALATQDEFTRNMKALGELRNLLQRSAPSSPAAAPVQGAPASPQQTTTPGAPVTNAPAMPQFPQMQGGPAMTPEPAVQQGIFKGLTPTEVSKLMLDWKRQPELLDAFIAQSVPPELQMAAKQKVQELMNRVQ